jgi:hypothetical protein
MCLLSFVPLIAAIKKKLRTQFDREKFSLSTSIKHIFSPFQKMQGPITVHLLLIE